MRPTAGQSAHRIDSLTHDQNNYIDQPDYRSSQASSTTSKRRSETREKHTVDSLVQEIDQYLAEQEDFRRARLQRADSRGTMFIDTLENGEMKISYRNDVQREEYAGPSEDATPAMSRYENQRGGGPHSRRNDVRMSLHRGHESGLPSGNLYTIDRKPGESAAYAPRKVEVRDGTVFARVAVNSAGCGIYVKKHAHRSTAPPPPRTSNTREARVLHGEPPQRPLPGSGLAAAFYHDGKVTGEADFRRPRPMRRFDTVSGRPAPRVVRRPTHERRRKETRGGLLDVIKELFRKVGGGENKSRQRRGNRHVGSTRDDGCLR
jgi:hypothetical protein